MTKGKNSELEEFCWSKLTYLDESRAAGSGNSGRQANSCHGIYLTNTLEYLLDYERGPHLVETTPY